MTVSSVILKRICTSSTVLKINSCCLVKILVIQETIKSILQEKPEKLCHHVCQHVDMLDIDDNHCCSMKLIRIIAYCIICSLLIFYTFILQWQLLGSSFFLQYFSCFSFLFIFWVSTVSCSHRYLCLMNFESEGPFLKNTLFFHFPSFFWRWLRQNI